MISRLAQRYQLRAPIIQAPMAGVSTVTLAAAVSNAGGLGSLGLGHLDTPSARQHIQALKKATSKAFNVNFFCHQPAAPQPDVEAQWLHTLQPYFEQFDAQAPTELGTGYQSAWSNPELIAMLCNEQPPIVSFHFGLPEASALAQLKAAQIAIWGCATTLNEALFLEQAGVDAIVAQGVEAGGHRGVFNPLQDTELSLLALLNQLKGHISVPIIAAGGLMDGQSIAAALLAGAEAAQLGTAFIASPESAADSIYKSKLLSTQAYHTAISSVISGRPARGLYNTMHQQLQPLAAQLPAYPVAYQAAKALHAAASAHHNYEYAPHWAGQAAPLARSLPAAELVQQLITELRQTPIYT